MRGINPISGKNLGPLFRTVRYLKPQQILARLEYKLRSLYYQSVLYPALEDEVIAPNDLLVMPTHIWRGQRKAGEEIIANNFTFVGRTISMGSEVKWYPAGASALWVYNLHYFEWLKHVRALNSNAKEHARDFITSWIDECSNFNKISWHPYPLSLRIISWLTHGKWLLDGANNTFKETFLASLTFQVGHLEKVLEWDVGGNHLIKNLKAIIYAGLCLPAKQSYYLDGVELLIKQLDIQVLNDGSHYELSPHYHVDVLKDLIDIHALIRKAGQNPPDKLSLAIDKMAEALEFYCYKDGKLAMFNDGSEGDKAEIRNILNHCGSEGGKIPLQLPDAGYIHIIRKQTSLFFDGAKCCPDNLPAHAHADSLSFELCLGKERIFTNSGTYAYQHNLRNKFRSTASHNTVCVDNLDSAEIWGAFRLGRRPTIIKCNVSEEPKVGVGIDASHNGYRHIGVTHNRKIFISEDGADIRGEDEIIAKSSGKTNAPVAHFHLHPDIKYSLKSNEEAIIETKSGQKLSFRTSGGRLHDAESYYSPQFGELITRRQLVLRGRMKDGKSVLKWAIKVL